MGPSVIANWNAALRTGQSVHIRSRLSDRFAAHHERILVVLTMPASSLIVRI